MWLSIQNLCYIINISLWTKGWRRQWHPTPVLLPGKSHGRRSLVGRLQSMWSLRVGCDWATSLSLFLSYVGEGNGSPLQCSCLENPRDGGAWWAAVYGVAQSRIRRKRLSSMNQRSQIIGLFLLECVCECSIDTFCKYAGLVRMS